MRFYRGLFIALAIVLPIYAYLIVRIVLHFT